MRREFTYYIGPLRILSKPAWDELLRNAVRWRLYAAAAHEIMTPEQREQVDARVAEFEANAKWWEDRGDAFPHARAT